MEKWIDVFKRFFIKDGKVILNNTIPWRYINELKATSENYSDYIKESKDITGSDLVEVTITFKMAQLLENETRSEI